jgi:hypothetical protein
LDAVVDGVEPGSVDGLPDGPPVGKVIDGVPAGGVDGPPLGTAGVPLGVVDGVPAAGGCVLAWVVGKVVAGEPGVVVVGVDDGGVVGGGAVAAGGFGVAVWIGLSLCSTNHNPAATVNTTTAANGKTISRQSSFEPPAAAPNLPAGGIVAAAAPTGCGGGEAKADGIAVPDGIAAGRGGGNHEAEADIGDGAAGAADGLGAAGAAAGLGAANADATAAGLGGGDGVPAASPSASALGSGSALASALGPTAGADAAAGAAAGSGGALPLVAGTSLMSGGGSTLIPATVSSWRTSRWIERSQSSNRSTHCRVASS